MKNEKCSKMITSCSIRRVGRRWCICWWCLGCVSSVWGLPYAHLLRVLWRCFGYATVVFWVCVGCVFGMSWVCVGYDLGMFWICILYVLAMSWGWVGMLFLSFLLLIILMLISLHICIYIYMFKFDYGICCHSFIYTWVRYFIRVFVLDTEDLRN